MDALKKNRELQTRVKSSTEHIKQLRSKADAIEDLYLMSPSAAPLITLLKETPQQVSFARSGVHFVEANMNHLRDSIKAAGMVRSITFSPAVRPTDSNRTDSEAYNQMLNVNRIRIFN